MLTLIVPFVSMDLFCEKCRARSACRSWSALSAILPFISVNEYPTYFHPNTVKPVLETTCIKQSIALSNHCSDTTFLLNQFPNTAF